jgi:hypothetical protein
MGRLEWICNTCGQGFESKRKRDSHREGKHRQNATIKVAGQEQEVKRSGSGKFFCDCGKEVLHARSLKRHKMGCIKSMFTVESVSRRSGNGQGMY